VQLRIFKHSLGIPPIQFDRTQQTASIFVLEASIDLVGRHQWWNRCRKEFGYPGYDGFLQIARVNCTSRIGPFL
jgi:hypothetical protein